MDLCFAFAGLYDGFSLVLVAVPHDQDCGRGGWFGFLKCFWEVGVEVGGDCFELCLEVEFLVDEVDYVFGVVDFSAGVVVV